MWIAASTHQGEEQQILNAHAILLEKVPECVLILVPRHPHRFNEVAALCKEANFHTVLRTEAAFCSERMQVLLGNTLGELLLYYASADIAFIGGSLIPQGGHNPLEPAALAKPLITGPHTSNFMAINHLLEKEQALYCVENSEQLAKQVEELLNKPELCQERGENACKVMQENTGAITKHLKLLEKYFYKKD